MAAFRRRNWRAFSRLILHSSSTMCSRSRAWEKFFWAASLRYSSQWLSSPLNRRYFSCSLSDSFMFWIGGWLFGVFVNGQIGGLGQRTFQVSLPLGELLIDRSQRKQAGALLEVEKGDALDGMDVLDAVFGRPLDALDEQLRGHLAAQSQQASQETMTALAFEFEDPIQVGAHRRREGAQSLFLFLGGLLAVVRMVGRFGKSLRAELGVAHPVGGQRIFGQTFPLPVDF